jgi:hypothetical protein
VAGASRQELQHMSRFYARPDPLIDSLPDRIRQAYYAAEFTLYVIDGLVGKIFANRADLLHKSIGFLRAFGDKNSADVQAVERELAVARKFAPFVFMGESHTSAHMAAIIYGEKVAHAVDEAVRPRWALIVDTGDGKNPEAAEWWVKGYRDHLARFGVVTVQGDSIIPGPEWTAFRKRFEGMLPSEQTGNLQTQMRLEVAALVEEEKANEDRKKITVEEEKEGKWIPANQAVTRAQKLGYKIDPSRLSRLSPESGVKTRPNQLGGAHRKKVEWSSLLDYLANEKLAQTDDEEPTGRERDRIEKRIEDASKKKKTERSLD